MRTATKDNRRATPMPAKKPVPIDSYRGRFAERLRELRAGRDVEKIVEAIQKAGFAHCKRATYYNWEGGITEPPLDALPALAKALRVTVPELFPAK